MPQDKNGIELQIGDRVTLECVVTAAYDAEFDHNLVVTTIERFNGGNCSQIHLNSKQFAAVIPMQTGSLPPNQASNPNAERT